MMSGVRMTIQIRSEVSVPPRKKIKQMNNDNENGQKELDDLKIEPDLYSDWRQKLKGVREINAYTLENKVLSDVTFEVGPEKVLFHAHKLILAFSSPVFEAMFYGPLAEKGEKVVIPDITPEGFKTLLKYIYTDSVSFDNENEAFKASTAAEKYCVLNLKEECEKHISRCPLKPDNVWILFENALFMGMNNISNRCLEFLKKNTKMAMEVDNFVETSIETVEHVLKMDSIGVSELTLLKNVVRWAEHKCMPEKNKDSIKELVRPLLKHIRFSTFTANEFCFFLEKEGYLFSDSDTLAILKHIIEPSVFALPDWCSDKLWRNTLQTSFLDYKEENTDLSSDYRSYKSSGSRRKYKNMYSSSSSDSFNSSNSSSSSSSSSE